MAKDGTLRAKKTLVNEQPRIVKYFPENTQKAVVLNFGNPETQRDILLNHVQARHPGMASIFNDNYYREIDEFIEYLEFKFPDLVEEAQSKRMGISPQKTKRITVEEKKKPSVIKSKTKEGKVYQRQKPRRFENKKVAVAFIKKRVSEGKTNKEITEDYNKFALARGWDTRTVSSISTLKSREGLNKK